MACAAFTAVAAHSAALTHLLSLLLLLLLLQVSFMPILVLAARLCPEGVEATLFATLMSILNAGKCIRAQHEQLLSCDEC
jgi:hypothetical protein